MITPRLSQASKNFMNCFKRYFQAKNVLLMFMSLTLFHMWLYNYSKNVLMWNILFHQLVLTIIHYKYCINMSIDLGDYVYETLEQAVFLSPYSPQRFSGSEYDSHDEETDNDEETERTNIVKSEWSGTHKKFTSSSSDSGSDSDSDSDGDSDNDNDSDSDSGSDSGSDNDSDSDSESKSNTEVENKNEHSDLTPDDEEKDVKTDNHSMTTRSKTKNEENLDSAGHDFVKVSRFANWLPWTSNNKFNSVKKD